GEDVLAGRKGGERHIEMRGRDGEVEDEVDLVIGQQGVDGEGAEAELARASFCDLVHDIGAGREPHAAEEGRIAQIGPGDVAAADDPYPQILHPESSSRAAVLDLRPFPSL